MLISILKKWVPFLGFGLLLCLPPIVAPYYQQIIFMWLLWSLVASAANLSLGYGGQANAGIAGFYMIGAYTTALLVLNLGLPWWVTIPAAGVVVGIVGMMISIPCMKLEGTYLIIATIAFTYIMGWLGDNWGSVTGGPEGLHGVPFPDAIQLGNLLTIDFLSGTARLYWLLGIVGLSVIIIWRITKSPLGKALIALRDNAALAESVGINIVLIKVLTFTISCFFIGIAGGCYAYLYHGVEPVSFTIMVTLYAFVIVVIGGIGTMAGPIVGAGIYVAVSEMLRGTQELSLIIFGTIFLLTLMFARSGIMGLGRGVLARMRG